MHLSTVDEKLDGVPGTVSVWVSRLDAPPAYRHEPDAPHYAASTMKAAILAAAYRLAEAGSLDLDADVPVHDDFVSAAPKAARFRVRHSYDNDDEVWARLGGTAPLRWLVRRMIVRSSNLATNLVLERTGTPPVATVWRDAGATTSVTGRGIEDYAARDAGIDNLVTAADLARLLTAIATGRIASADSCAEMMEILEALPVDSLAAGLPPGTRIAHKTGWIEGIRHDAGVVLPADAPPYVIAACTTISGWSDDDQLRLIADISAAAWADRTAY